MAVPQPDLQLAAAATVALSQRYEAQLFRQAAGHGRVVPVLVISGFLGSGKTTLLHHLLNTCGRELKLGVLVNEVASLDIDGQLLHAPGSNAAAGIRAAQLAGGCACCSVSGDLQAALGELAGSSSYNSLDYLLLETSGVADVEPLAHALMSAGFKLAGVVTVVDAEAGAQQLKEQEVARAQLLAADVVVLNKCDLASLAAVSDVEDLVQELVPGSRMLRARYGQVPGEALLDLDVAEHQMASTAGAAAAPPHQEQQQQQQQQHQEQQQGPGAHGEIAFLSHEPVVSATKPRRPHGSLLWSSKGAKLAAAAAATTQQAEGSSSQAGETAHHHHHSSFGSVSFSSPSPLCMACFQGCVARHLLGAAGLFRAKGFVCFDQARELRFVFHLSGKQRAECGAEGAWQQQPGVQLVLIGHEQQQLAELEQRLQGCVAGRCSCCGTAAGQQHAAAGAALNPAAARFAELVGQHHQLELVPQAAPPPQQLQPSGSVPDSGLAGLVQFSAVGSPLHGVIADEVNASLLRKANATAGLFLCHIKSPTALTAASGSSQHVAYQGIACLQACFSAAGGAVSAAEQAWQLFSTAVAPVLRKSYQHVHNCKCDVVQLMAN